MKNLLKYHLYIIGFTTLIISAILLNWDCPPNYDEAHAWNIARYLSLKEIFTISKTEGHPFLWYYLLMPIAKTNFLYPYILYLLNLTLILSAFYLLYKYAPFPTYLKYLITFSAPFLQLYTSFTRSYTLGILLLFAILSLYPHRHKKNILYLSLILLTANTNLICFFGAFLLGILYFCENIKASIQQKNVTISTLQTIIAGLLETTLIIIQFYGFDTNIPKYTPTFNPLIKDINSALFPLNTYTYIILILCSLYIFYKNKKHTAIFFLTISQILLFITFQQLYHGSIHHHNFFYIYLICSYWLSDIKTISKSPINFLPLTMISAALIFNPSNQYKIKDLNKNITLLNQTATDFKSLKGFQESLYHFYIPINRYTIAHSITKTPDILLYRTCEEPSYYNSNLAFHIRYKLNSRYCLYDAKIKQDN